ncbi:hypothetical protein HanXRQr2_Chr12g0551231 [Helianthus annuus]|uniref:Uncharacterized protein n=1 Tax=Helianthus annuus TaxID=4232 RepID=A0A9K3HI91_HELAN|nr:hypothetical protein HanXRQr2_Chr12g0551231 [Helianthus annuus]KAJ0863499.1 hypothetical protein HanPSC8_Chr12g0530711 [Helianthus annuus]
MIQVGTNKRIKTMFNGKKGRNGLNNEMVNKDHSNISAKCWSFRLNRSNGNVNTI